MRRILVRNPDLASVEKTFLTADYTSGTTLSVINTFAFAADDLIVVGNPTEEKSELKKISAIASDTSLTLASALKFSHPKDTPISECPWDTVDIEGNSGSGFNLITSSGLQFDKQYTVYEHSDGTGNWNYRWRFYNSVTGTYSEYSPTYSGSGFDPDQVGYMIQQVRKITNTDGDVETIKDYEIVRSLNAATEIIYGSKKDWWFLKFDDDGIAATADDFRYNLDALGGGSAGSPLIELGFIDRIRYHHDSGAEDITYNLEYKSESEFDDLIKDGNRQGDNHVSCYTLRPGDVSSVNGYLECYPTPVDNGVGTFLVSGYQKPPILEDSVDATPVPIPHILENYAIAVIERIRGNDSKAEYYEELFYGPPPGRQDIRRLTGIALLEQLQERNKPAGQPKSLWRFRGQKAISRLYRNRYYSNDYVRETYW